VNCILQDNIVVVFVVFHSIMRLVEEAAHEILAL
jgi:hypothetical protein